MTLKLFSLIFSVFFFKEIAGHGMMLEPPNRSSLWRFYPDAIPNYNDNSNYCGGIIPLWQKFGGKCGLCGDALDAPHPQENENTGKYGNYGSIRTYTAGSEIPIEIHLTANHLGYFQYSICKLENQNAPEPGEDCFQPLTLGDGSDTFYVPEGEFSPTFNHTVILPKNLVCDRCVLRWHHKSGNQWGKCDDGTYGKGCGPQEIFRNCADVTIKSE